MQIEDRRGHTALYFAVSKESRRIVRLLLNHGGDFYDMKFVEESLESYGWDLFRAAEENRVDIAYALLLRGADVNAKNEDGQTSEELALREHSRDMAQFLITFKMG